VSEKEQEKISEEVKSITDAEHSVKEGKAEKKRKTAYANENDEDYQFLLRKNFYNHEDRLKKKQLFSMRILSVVLLAMLIIFVSLYLVKLNDSTMLLDKMIGASVEYVYENVTYIEDSQIKFVEVVSELNVIRTLMNHNGSSSTKQYCISELYYIAVQLPDTFINHRSEIYTAFKNLTENKEDVAYALLDELLNKIVDERK
jgi:aminoglycoside N3'-acetyltransferase